jgi:hypothetical protein
MTSIRVDRDGREYQLSISTLISRVSSESPGTHFSDKRVNQDL